MNSDRLGRALLRSRWVRAFTVALGAALLVPIPALAFTFIGGWTTVSAVVSPSNGATLPRLVGFTNTNRHANARSTVFVNMGSTQIAGPVTSTLVVQQLFRIGATGPNQLAITGMVDTLFKNASFSVTTTIGKLSGTTFTPVQGAGLLSGTVPNTPGGQVVNKSARRKLHKLRPGRYAIRLTFVYTKGQGGGWQDAGASPASPSKF
jgi:hypothetical protein